MKRHFLILLLLSGIFSGFSQTRISGVITNEQNKGLGGATVSISGVDEPVILAYDISDGSGEFAITLESDLDSLELKVSHMGYKDHEESFLNRDHIFTIRLTESAENLKEVFLEATNIDRSGDTISYNVSAFKGLKDRVIADVLARMPGIEIKSSGAIFYQGRPIQKYYIEGLDLLEGRYSLVNENLPANAVSELQILENHQPIKILDSLVFSERASLNIKLKNSITTTGSAKLGAGFSPLLWDTNITPMLLTKDEQAIFSIQANNTGNEVSDVLTDYGSFGDDHTIEIRKQDWLSLTKVIPPPFSKERWLDNNVILGAANYLIKFKNSLELKANVSYLNDVQQFLGSTHTQIFTPTDTISFNENIANEAFTNSLQSQVTLEQNTQNNYIKNAFKFESYKNSENGIVRREGLVNQELENPFLAISNDFKMLKALGEQLITFKSHTGYTRTPQELRVRPGQFEELVNDGNEYDALFQELDMSHFFTENSAGFTKGLGNFTLSPAVGFSLQDQKLNSEIQVLQADNASAPGGDFQNSYDFTRSKLFLKNTINYSSGSWRIRVKLPLALATFNLNEEHLNKWIFSPDFYLKKEITPLLESSVSIGLDHSFGKIDRMYPGYILRNYRNIQHYNAPLGTSFQQNYNWRFSYRNPLNSIFAYGSYRFNRRSNNLLYNSIFSETGAKIYEAVEKENIATQQVVSVGGSKYFGKLNATLTVGARYTAERGEQLINQVITDVVNENLSLDLKAKITLTSWLQTEYENSFAFFHTRFTQQEFDPILAQKHFWDMTVFPTNNQYLEIRSEWYNNTRSGNTGSNYFLNLNYQYTFAGKGIDLNLGWTNVFNTEEFFAVYNADFSYVQSNYRLRPSQVLVRVNFSF